ncbi:hypothetical protein [Streptomyces sp. Inha503]
MALPDTTAPLSLHSLVQPVSRALVTVSRAGTGNGDGGSAPRG